MKIPDVDGRKVTVNRNVILALSSQTIYSVIHSQITRKYIALNYIRLELTAVKSEGQLWTLIDEVCEEKRPRMYWREFHFLDRTYLYDLHLTVTAIAGYDFAEQLYSKKYASGQKQKTSRIRSPITANLLSRRTITLPLCDYVERLKNTKTT